MSRITRSALSIMTSMALVVSALAVGCASPPEPSTSQPAATEPGAVGQPTEESPGAMLVKQKCTMCHTLDRVDSATYDEAGWTATVERMEKNGLVISADEKVTIIDYLSSK